MQNNKSYFTSDLALSATLLTLHFQIETIDRSNPKKVIFIFKKDKGLEQTIEKYWNGQLQVSPLTLLQNLKALKSRIYQ